MASTVTMHISGFAELKKALEEMKKTTAKGAMIRVLKGAGQPIAGHASQLAPKESGELAASIIVTAKFDKSIGKSAYAKVMKGGGTKSQAVAAMRGAQREKLGRSSTAKVFIGPAKATNKKDAIKRNVQEFGSVKQKPNPYMRPAFDQGKHGALHYIETHLGAEIKKTAERAARRAAAKAIKLSP